MDRRTHIRYELMQNIEYVTNGTTSEEVLKGIIIDISDVGIGIYTFKPVRVGQKIMIRNGLDNTCHEMTVRWCKELGENVYRAGLLFNNRP